MSSRKKILFASVLAAVGAVFGAALQPAKAAENTIDKTDQVALAIAAQCSFSSNGGASMEDGTYIGTALGGSEATFSDGGVRLFNVTCNHAAGYSIHAYTTSLIEESDSDKVIPFVKYANYATSGNYGNWTAQVKNDDAADFGTSATNMKVIKHTTTASQAAGDDLQITYRAYVSKSTPAGTYTGQAVYVLAMNIDDGATAASSYTLTYDANGGTNAPAAQSGSSAIATVTDAMPKKAGYRFLGWSLDQNAMTPTYLAGSKISISTKNTTPTLYAVWGGYPSMQSFNKGSCEALSVGGRTIRQDERDGKLYVVAKLADNKCWMMQDLDLDLSYETDSGTGRTYMGTGTGSSFVKFTNANTDLNGNRKDWQVLPSDSGEEGNLAYFTQTSGQTGADYKWNAYGTTGAAGSTTTTDYYEVRSYDSGDLCIRPFNLTTADTSGYRQDPCNDDGIGSANTQRVGNYYNWPAATAGSGTYKNDAQYDVVPDSICPKGWKLPRGGTTEESNGVPGSFGNLFRAEGVVTTVTTSTSISNKHNVMAKITGHEDYNGTTLEFLANDTYHNKLTFLRSGYFSYSSGAVSNRGYNGLYWSSTVNSATSAYRLNFNATNVNPGANNNSKGNGNAVRCVAI